MASVLYFERKGGGKDISMCACVADARARAAKIAVYCILVLMLIFRPAECVFSGKCRLWV